MFVIDDKFGVFLVYFSKINFKKRGRFTSAELRPRQKLILT